jgi:hypothetical protein
MRCEMIPVHTSHLLAAQDIDGEIMVFFNEFTTITLTGGRSVNIASERIIMGHRPLSIVKKQDVPGKCAAR